MRLALAIVFALLAGSALAHDDYPPDCCSDNAVTGDCRPVACREIEQTGPASWRHGKSEFSASAIRQPIDDRCHVCKSEPLGRCIMFPRPKMSWRVR